MITLSEETSLELKSIHKAFGGLVAVDNINAEIKRGEFLGLIGPNGAGKSVLLSIISGLHKPDSGSVIFEGEDVTGYRPDKLVAKGIGRTFQLATLFFELPVIDNIMLGNTLSKSVNLWEALFNTASNRKKDKDIKEKSLQILEFLGLIRFKDEQPKNLPYAIQKLIAIGTALASNPKLLLLDEPISGLDMAEVPGVMDKISSIHGNGVTILLVEHNMRAVMRYCERIVVMNLGCRIAEGSPSEIQQNSEVIKSYLGA